MQGELNVDAGFWGGIVPDNAGQHTTLQAMVDSGVLGFKSFMIPSGAPRDGLSLLGTSSAGHFPILLERRSTASCSFRPSAAERHAEARLKIGVCCKVSTQTRTMQPDLSILSMCAGINDFPNVSEEDIRKALPFLKEAGVPYYVHAELQQDDAALVSLRAYSMSGRIACCLSTSTVSFALHHLSTFHITDRSA